MGGQGGGGWGARDGVRVGGQSECDRVQVCVRGVSCAVHARFGGACTCALKPALPRSTTPL